MRNGTIQNGTTILELLLVLGLVALLATALLPAVGGARDRIAVRSAANAFSHTVRSARLGARQSGGARVRVSLDSARVDVLRVGVPARVLSLSNEFGVTLDAKGSRAPELRFDALGLGRFASRTFTVVRGQVRRNVVISSYGRVDVR